MLYLPSLGHGFVWDDTYFLVDTPYLRDAELWWRQVMEPLFVSRNYFRPLPLLAFVAETRLGGGSPFLFHLANVALHAANVTLVVLLARALAPRATGAACAAGLLFAVHPALVENVCWISDRFDLMMTFFLLAALLCERRLSRVSVRAAAVSVLFLLALLSKETAVVMLALLPLWQFVRVDGAPLDGLRGWWARGDAAVWAALPLTLGGYLLLRHAALGYLYVNDSQITAGDALQHLLLIGKTVGWYVSLAAWPFGRMAPVHPTVTPVALDDVGAWLGLATALAASGLIVYALARKPALRPTALAGAMALAALAPVSNLVPLTIGDNLVHDRYLILPIAFVCLAGFLAWREVPRAIAAAPLLAWGSACAIAVAMLVPRWQDNLSLWSWAYARSPASHIATDNYVAALVNAGRNDETVDVARTVLALTPDAPNVTQNLALALARLGRYDEAANHARRAIELFESHDAMGRLNAAEAWNLLGYIQLQQGEGNAAQRSLTQAIAAMPRLSRPHYNLALLHYDRGEWTAGDAELAIAVRYAPPALAAAFRRLGAERKRAAAGKTSTVSRQSTPRIARL